MPVNITRRSTRSGDERYVVRYRIGGRDARVQYGGSFRTRAEAELRQAYIRRLIASGANPDEARMTETSIQAALRTVLCAHPACTEEAEAGRSTCRRHRADRGGPVDPAALAAAFEDDGRLCKVDGCPHTPASSRGPFAGLCEDHAAAKRLSHGSRVASGMGSVRAPTGPLETVKRLRSAAIDLEKAQTRYDAAKADLTRAKRAWRMALQDAQAAS